MELLPDELRAKIPPLGSQDDEPVPIAYAKFYIPGSDYAWYPIEGEADGNDFLFFGLVFDPDFDWRDFTLSELTTTQGPLGTSVERDTTFQEGPFTDVVPAPD